MTKYLNLAAGLFSTLAVAGCEVVEAERVSTQVSIDKDGNRIEETLWRYPDSVGGEEVWVKDVFPPGSNEARRGTRPPVALRPPRRN